MYNDGYNQLIQKHCDDSGQRRNARRKNVLLCNPDFSLFVEFCKKIQIEGKIAAADQQKVQKAVFSLGVKAKTSD